MNDISPSPMVNYLVRFDILSRHMQEMDMKIGVMGTGMVGHALAGKLAALGHEVMMAAREADNPKARDWAKSTGQRSGTYAEAAAFAEVVVFAVNGSALLSAAESAGPALAGKVVIDVTNPLDTSRDGMPVLIPEMSNTTSAGEMLQASHPEARVVKALNTMNCAVMVDPGRVPGQHDVFLCGNDDAAKATVSTLLRSFGWAAPIDLGPIEAARGMESMMPFWLRLWQALGTADFNYRIAR
ncbi:NADPH-dependent F420 reductase [Paracoccus albus]|uniref:NADPH-dependent F420 reductase n=1 Tax=Paracoccus albus TaxID=3017784 RepID=UPI0022F0E9EC|nr:NAD(P)-binding domain-containing protein [Paracoccus albus]WBU59244.1 NAD(P)-binding domain-containing protein [Paracoccus albus]